ncbi:D-alanyl-D-alanine carboxypeptidase/D-alanyl-D-alanine endopeptidase [Roseicyclus sp.]|uniref:D-alanyl-D-alanine carboxypeptidase/D-alanyl-D-alanine endopeptidase n=1 Tax=Roseicyclus sp. TaxID=1914329 RepID=UPI003F6C2ABF
MASRRAFLSGLAAFAATPAIATAPAASLRPIMRPAGLLAGTIPSVQDLVAEAAIGGRVGCVVADATTGEILEGMNPLLPLPPASVTKAVTCGYALERLGPGYRFETRIVADGTISNGRLEGDLWLVGSGDPTLDTDTLASMAAALRAQGLHAVTGRLMVADGALPAIFEVDPSQPPHLGYNPAISGLNLNFNRVYFEWVRQSGDYTIALDARSETLRPAVQIARMRIADRRDPIYTYENIDGRDHWTVAREALGDSGSRWLPVRRPSAYAAEVFATLARAAGISFSDIALAPSAPAHATVLVAHRSEPMEVILRDMMRWSTNLTAEVVGLKATMAGGQRPVDLAQSAGAMSVWMRARLGARQAGFVDHSGLGDQSRLRPHDMVSALVAAGPTGALRGMMRAQPMLDQRGRPIADHPVQVAAKTGTLNFVSSLAGYARLPSGRDVAFAIFCADTARRDALTEAERERPEGARPYNQRAKRLQQQLIERWAALYA